MKRGEVIKRIEREAQRQGVRWTLARNGARHDVYALDGVKIPIARRASSPNRVAGMVWKECEEKLGKGWWR